MNDNKVVSDQCVVHSGFTLFMIIVLVFMFSECTHSSNHRKELDEVQKENNSLKKIIITSIERCLVNHMKNGNDPEEHDNE